MTQLSRKKKKKKKSGTCIVQHLSFTSFKIFSKKHVSEREIKQRNFAVTTQPNPRPYSCCGKAVRFKSGFLRAVRRIFPKNKR